MERKSILALTLMLGSVFTATACAARGGYTVAYGPPPPPRHMGVMGMAPGPGYVWVDGFWEPRGREWFWVGGHWVRPPYPRAVWVPGYYARHGNRHEWRQGYWRR